MIHLRFVRFFLWVLLCACFSQHIYSHTLNSSFLVLEEISPDVFQTQWTPAQVVARSSHPVQPQYPSHCQLDGRILHCQDGGLIGSLTLSTVPQHSDTMVRIQWLDGNSVNKIINTQAPIVELPESGFDPEHWTDVVGAYTAIGVEHILLGIDHLLFVVGLILLIHFNRKLIWTITAFTIAHSITLGLSIFNLLYVSQATVEVVIALSIVLVAYEALHSRQTLARRFPWLVAIIFGLVHGLGFAGALREVGLPESAQAISLFSFNLGVELGQIAVVMIIYLLTNVVRRIPFFMAYTRPVFVSLCYGLGAISFYWTLERLSGWTIM